MASPSRSASKKSSGPAARKSKAKPKSQLAKTKKLTRTVAKPKPKAAAKSKLKSASKAKPPAKSEQFAAKPKASPTAFSSFGANRLTPVPPAAPRKNYSFSVGDKVVYPHHGAAMILKKEKNTVDGKRVDYFVLEVATDQLIVRVPVDRAAELGTRPVISQNQARKVFTVFGQTPEEAGSNWSRWYKVLTEKLNSGDIFQVAEVVRDLRYAQDRKGISPALKRMLTKAMLILTSEIGFALNVTTEEATDRIERSLPTVLKPLPA